MVPSNKRRATPVQAVDSPRKKIKSADRSLPVRPLDAQTEEDSDPIGESDTFSESGADDGASWPSKAASDEEDSFEGLEDGADDVGDEEEEEEEPNGGGVTVAETPSRSKPDGKIDSSMLSDAC